MAAFKFRLATVLRLREHIKEQKHSELRSLHETRLCMLAEIDALEGELAMGDAVLRERQMFTAIELRLRAEHDQSLAKQIKLKRAQLAKFDETVVLRRAELVDAMRAVKSLEQLRQRHEARHWREQNAAEQKFGDEVAQRTYARSAGRKKIPQ